MITENELLGLQQQVAQLVQRTEALETSNNHNGQYFGQILAPLEEFNCCKPCVVLPVEVACCSGN